MPSNTLAPNGLVYSRQRAGGSATMQPSIRQIKNGYASAIGLGDLVKTLTGANQGYMGLATNVDTSILGIFAGIVGAGVIPGATGGGYYDRNLQSIAYGLNGSYVATAAPPVGTNIGAAVIDDPFAIFRIQLSGVTWSDSYYGLNVNFVANGAPNASGISTLYADGTTIAATNTLPLRILGPSGVVGGPQDPNNTNPWIEVCLNTPEATNSTGI